MFTCIVDSGAAAARHILYVTLHFDNYFLISFKHLYNTLSKQILFLFALYTVCCCMPSTNCSHLFIVAIFTLFVSFYIAILTILISFYTCIYLNISCLLLVCTRGNQGIFHLSVRPRHMEELTAELTWRCACREPLHITCWTLSTNCTAFTLKTQCVFLSARPFLLSSFMSATHSKTEYTYTFVPLTVWFVHVYEYLYL